jgi:hypothetical protein
MKAKIIKAKKLKTEWIEDKKGYFLIQKKDSKIFAHYYKNHIYQFSIQGFDAETIYYTILRKKLISTLQHAAYLGSELKKAELTKEEDYVQDA